VLGGVLGDRRGAGTDLGGFRIPTLVALLVKGIGVQPAAGPVLLRRPSNTGARAARLGLRSQRTYGFLSFSCGLIVLVNTAYGGEIMPRETFRDAGRPCRGARATDSFRAGGTGFPTWQASVIPGTRQSVSPGKGSACCAKYHDWCFAWSATPSKKVLEAEDALRFPDRCAKVLVASLRTASVLCFLLRAGSDGSFPA